MADYIPKGNFQFDVWQTNLVNKTETNYASWGIPKDSFTRLKEGQAPWTLAFAVAKNRHNRTSADVQARNDARKTYKKEIRIFVSQWLSKNTAISNGERVSLGITVPSATHTPSAVPATSPEGTVDFSARQQHTIRYRDAAASLSKAKPKGVYGCEIWINIGGETPGSIEEFTFLSVSTRSPYKATLHSKDAGKTAWYCLRWINTRGIHGPWSNPIGGIIVG
jgi:hypothetical protein